MSGKKDKKYECGDKRTVTPVDGQKQLHSTQRSKVKAECGCTVKAPAEQTQKQVYCPPHGHQHVAKKDQRKKGGK